MKLFRCTTCRHEKPWTAEFFPRRGGSKLRGRCRECENTSARWRRLRKAFGAQAKPYSELTPEGAKRRAAALRRKTVKKRAAKAQPEKTT